MRGFLPLFLVGILTFSHVSHGKLTETLHQHSHQQHQHEQHHLRVTQNDFPKTLITNVEMNYVYPYMDGTYRPVHDMVSIQSCANSKTRFFHFFIVLLCHIVGSYVLYLFVLYSSPACLLLCVSYVCIQLTNMENTNAWEPVRANHYDIEVRVLDENAYVGLIGIASSEYDDCKIKVSYCNVVLFCFF